MNKISEKKKLSILNNTTCYEAVEKHNCPCERMSCKQWINFPNGKNCVMVTTQAGPLTLNEIGDIYGLTRMRICQIEKNIYQKIRNVVQ
jgi:DNA-directed RNA polymerase specialized sigma subunit